MPQPEKMSAGRIEVFTSQSIVSTNKTSFIRLRLCSTRLLHLKATRMSEGAHTDMNMTMNNDADEMPVSQSGTNINQCQLIVNGLLTYVIYMINNSTDPKLVKVTGRYFDLGQVIAV